MGELKASSTENLKSGKNSLIKNIPLVPSTVTNVATNSSPQKYAVLSIVVVLKNNQGKNRNAEFY